METITPRVSDAFALAVKVINELVEVDAIWCFGVRSKSDRRSGGFYANARKCDNVHLYLVVYATSELQGGEGKSNDAILRKSNGSITATSLIYGTAKLSKIKGNHLHFMREALACSILLYNKKDFIVPEFKAVGPDNSAKLAYWNHCRYMAICCLEAENAIENPSGESLQAILLGQAVEQVCLGVIYVFLGCRPNNHRLDFLLDLCDLFFPAAADIFPRCTNEEKKRFAVVSSRMESLRYRADRPSITDIEIIRSRVQRLLEEAVDSVRKRSTLQNI